MYVLVLYIEKKKDCAARLELVLWCCMESSLKMNEQQKIVYIYINTYIYIYIYIYIYMYLYIAASDRLVYIYI